MIYEGGNISPWMAEWHICYRKMDLEAENFDEFYQQIKRM